MADDFGIDDLLQKEWERFTQALEDLADGGHRRARQLAARTDPASPQTRVISMPGLESVFTLYPRPQVTTEQYRIHFRAVASGQPSPLHPALVAEINRRIAVADRIAASPSPQWAQAYGSALTAIDNVQDLLTTVSVLGRLALGPIARAFERGLPDVTRAEALLRAQERAAAQLAARKAAGEAFTELGERRLREAVRRKVLQEASQQLLNPRRLASRFALPLLGVVMTAADLLNLMTMLGMIAFPGYAAFCAGAGAAMAAGVPATIFGTGLKGIASKSGSLNPFSRKARLARSATLRTIRPSFFNLLEVAQTTKELFGVGLTFGGIVGFIQDAAFGVEQARRGREVTVRSPHYAHTYHRLMARKLAAVPLAQLDDLRAASIVLAWGPLWFDPAAPLTIEERIEAAAAMHTAWSLLRPWLEAPEMDEALELAERDGPTPPQWALFDTHGLLEAAGRPAAGRSLWPLTGSPERLLWYAVASEQATAAAQGLETLVFPIRGQIEGQLLAALAARITERSMIVLTGSTQAFRYELTTGYQTVESLALRNRLLHAGDPRERRLRFFALADSRLETKRGRSLDLPELEQLAREAGIRLIPLRPTDAGPADLELDQGHPFGGSGARGTPPD